MDTNTSGNQTDTQDLFTIMDNIQKEKHSFTEGVALAKQIVLKLGGEYCKIENGVIDFVLDGDTATAFQLYADSDHFYFEM